ncbi:ABC transporter permease [Microcoleus sp. FACHB-672]|uniref:ABC transporter permease n=1 Tax=Microcoleus sp. FACHB-672 TaxID=2692825 RepID=UPI001686CFFA|nr:ABC transporter permease [Microcoleus sp. FACHB-672]MBD2042494.1 ABC transporter permease [Microcoleus sp. FACHB-672]
MSLAPFDLLALTCNSLRGNPLRSALTTLGVFMGVAAVSATLQVGNISKAVLQQQLAERDAPHLRVFALWDRDTGQRLDLKLEDMEFLRQRIVGLQAISAGESTGAPKTVFQGEEATPDMQAVSLDYLLTTGRQLVAGRFFNPGDFASYRPVVVIDEFLVETLFQGEDPINQRIYADSRPYIVVGVVPTKESLGEPEGQLLLPMSVHSALTGRRDIGEIWLRPYKMEDLADMGEQVKKLLEQRFPGQKFYIYNSVKKIIEQQKTLELVSQALLALGAISLLVGGVGIANISIAAVMERTPEIGLRRAIGATQTDIMLQFILEAAILSLVGGMVAIVTVHGLTVVVAETFTLPYEFETGTAALALGSALLVGVGAGFMPAIRASRLDPVKALRSE